MILMSLIYDEKPKRLSAPNISEDILLRIAKKDNEALRVLYEETNKAVYGFAYSIVKNPQDAQDIMQDTYVQVYSAAETYKKQGKPMAWIFTITRNLALMKLRSDKRISSVDVEDTMSTMVSKAFDADTEEKMIILAALNKLNDESRQIVVLHAVTGMKHKEIATVMDLGLSTVLSKYHRALKQLRTILEEDNQNGR